MNRTECVKPKPGLTNEANRHLDGALRHGMRNGCILWRIIWGKDNSAPIEIDDEIE
jgi:hypothetical protein